MATSGFLFLVLATCAGITKAWGPDGHTVVAHLATHFLKPEVLQAMNNELGKTNLSVASNWCDDFCHTDAGRWSAPLHFINYEGHACSFNWDRDCPDDWCNVGAIVNYTKQVFNRSLDFERRQMALFFVIHMTGDLHQPLHVSRKEDLGGNSIQISYDFSEGGNDTRDDNLHSVWDVDLVTQGIVDLQQQTGGQLAQVILGGGPQPYHNWPVLQQSLLKQMTEGNWSQEVAQWRHTVSMGAAGMPVTSLESQEAKLREGLSNVAEETAKLSCSYGYAQPDGSATQSGDFLDRSYYTWARPVVEVQLAKAGARLAQLLSDAFAASEAAAPDVLVV